MDYRSRFELEQQILEEARVAQSLSPNKHTSRRSNTSSDAAPPVAAAAPVPSAAQSSPFMPSTTLPDDPTALVREVPGAENIKALNAAVEHAEAVQRYMERENLSLEESARYIMANGSTGQKLSFFAHVREQLEELDQRRISKVLDILLDSMWAQDPELQCHVPEDLLSFLGLTNSTTAGQLLEVTKTMLMVKTAAVREAWGTLLLGLAGCLTPQQIENELIPLALKKAEHAEPQDQRELSCDLLGRVCQYISRAKVEELVVPQALALCQDTNIGVRQHICQQLGVIARTLGVKTAKVKIAPDLFELLNDEERAVSRMAFSCLIDLVEFFGPEYRKERLYPIIKQYVSDPPSEVVCLLVGDFGRFLHEIQSDITTTEDVELFATFFATASQKPDDEARRHCAYHLPAVVASLPLTVFPTHLAPCLNRLAGDTSAPVRRCIAAGLHELVALLGDGAATQLETPFLTLLKDEDRQVLSLLFRHCTTLLDCFVAQLRGSARDNFFRALTNRLLKLAPLNCTNWRYMQHIIRIISTYLEYFDEDALMEKFAPLLLNYVVRGACALKSDCARLLVCILHVSTNATTQVQLFSRLNNEYAHSACCYKRQSYLYFVNEVCQLFSRRCVRERLLECTLELHRDPVVAVRLALARSLCGLSKALRPGNPGTLEDEFNNMQQRLLMDEDADVRAAARESVEKLQQQERLRLVDCCAVQQDELLDQRREKEEQVMLDMAKECDKGERRAKLRDMLKMERGNDHADGGGSGGGLHRSNSLRKITGSVIAARRKSAGKTPTTPSSGLLRMTRNRSPNLSIQCPSRKRPIN